jgi:Uma2 family endonuclease
MEIAEIVLPETKPETEWVRGRALQKMSPTRSHSRLQTEFGYALTRWAQGRGEVGTEWRFRIAPDGEVRRPLVPDVSFTYQERLRGLTDDELEVPPFAPDVAIEILSPGDRPKDVASKVDVYLRGGGTLVLVVDPKHRTIRAIDAAAERTFSGNDSFEHVALPGFTFVVEAFFETALRRSI